MSKRILVGHISVDTGLCMVGDPCYRVGAECTDWSAFLEKYPQILKMGLYARVDHEFDVGGDWVAGAAMVVSTGYGDGAYPVCVTVEDGRVARVTVEFVGEEDEDES